MSIAEIQKAIEKLSTEDYAKLMAWIERRLESDRDINILSQQIEINEKQTARDNFLSRSRQSQFRSSSPYPSREELHERN
jgi:hypothetical protein